MTMTIAHAEFEIHLFKWEYSVVCDLWVGIYRGPGRTNRVDSRNMLKLIAVKGESTTKIFRRVENDIERVFHSDNRHEVAEYEIESKKPEEPTIYIHFPLTE
jgi:hypothetical protein